MIKKETAFAVSFFVPEWVPCQGPPLAALVFAQQNRRTKRKETSERMSLFFWCARRDLNCRGAVLRRVDRCREVLEIQGLQEIMLLNAAGLYYQILKL